MTTELHRAFDHVPQFILAKRLHSGIYQFDEHGELEKRCSTCRDYWPADSEFFYLNPRNDPDGLHCMCKDCCQQTRARSLAKAAARTTLNHPEGAPYVFPATVSSSTARANRHHGDARG